MRTTTVGRRVAVLVLAAMCFGVMDYAKAQTLPVLANVSTNADKQPALLNVNTGATTVIVGSSPLTGAAMAISDTAYDTALHHMFVVDASNNKLLTISMVDGSVVSNPTLSLPAGVLGVTDLEWDSGASTLFGIVTITGGDKQLATFNTSTGAASLVGASGIGGGNVGTYSQPFDLDPVGHRYYMVANPAAGYTLYAINTATGAVADSVLLAGKLPAGTTTIYGLEYDTGESKLYGLIGLTSNDKQLVSINTTHGSTFGDITLIGQFGIGGGQAVSLSGSEALDATRNIYYAEGSFGGNATLFEINTTTGGATLQTLTFGPTINDVRALEFDPSFFPSARTDLNADGKSDIVLQNSSTGNVAGWLMDGFTITSGATIGTPATSWAVAATGDFNGDGKADILLQNSGTGDVAEWQMNGTTIAAGAAIASPGTAWKVIGTGDFNGDGKADIVLQNSSTGDIVEWQMNGTAITSGGLVASPGTAWKVIGSGDFDGNGKSDLVLQNSSTGAVAVWLMNGFTISSGAVIGTPATSWKVIGSGDFNADGKADLVLQNTSTGSVAAWLISGTTLSSGTVVANPGTSWSVLGTGDFNADGKADIVVRDTTGRIAEWQMNGMAIAAGAVVASPASTWQPIVK